MLILLNLFLLLQISQCNIHCDSPPQLNCNIVQSNVKFDVVLCSYHEYNPDVVEGINKKYNCKRSIVYPDTFVPILVSKRDLPKLKKEYGQRIMTLSPGLDQ